MSQQQDYHDLVQEILKHNKAYFEDNQPLISDEAYDVLLQKLLKIEAEHPDWILAHSPSQKVGQDLQTGFEQHLHQYPMLSLANTYSEKEVHAFIDRLKKEMPSLEFCCELKVDGLAISLIYENGFLTKAVTRGDGKRGDIVTENVKTLQNLPLNLHGNQLPDYLELRGEVYMEKKTFHALNDQREEEGLAPWANPRNAAAGSLKLLDASLTKERKLKCFVYGLASFEKIDICTHFQTHEYLKSLKLPVLPFTTLCEQPDKIFSFYQDIENKRASLSFDIDGIVIKLNSLKGQQKMGFTGKNPRWAVAYKFAAKKATTLLEDITLQVGRTGVITPVAELKTVTLEGSSISRASLHNEEEVQRKDIRIGDWVVIEKGGDVIPKVVGVVEEKRKADSVIWKMPYSCPSCSQPIQQLQAEVAYRCFNPQCPAQNLNKLVYFVGKEGMDIEFLGKKVLEKLLDEGLIITASDLYRLDEEKLQVLEGFKDKSIQRLLSSIEASKQCSLAKFLMALGIRYVGTQTAELLAQHFPNLENYDTISLEALLAIDGIGEKVAKEVLSFFQDPKQQILIQELLTLGVKPQAASVSSAVSQVFEGKSFVITGSLEKYTRQQAMKLIKERGGKVSSSLSKNTTALICGEKPGSKLDKAKQLGLVVMTEKDFEKTLL